MTDTFAKRIVPAGGSESRRLTGLQSHHSERMRPDEQTSPALRRPGEVAPVRRVAKPEQLQRRIVAESRDGLERVLEAIRTGELTASAGCTAPDFLDNGTRLMVATVQVVTRLAPR